jgi:hypothetical protein
VSIAPLPAPTVVDGGVDVSGGAGHSIASYFDAFAPAPAWDDLVAWPPDVFALANLVLDHTEAYRFVVAPPRGRRWPELPDWGARVSDAAVAWCAAVDAGESDLPPLVRGSFETVTRNRGVPLEQLRRGTGWATIRALLTLHAIADEACARIASAGTAAAPRPFEKRAWELLQRHGSLARLSPARVRIVPKTHFSTRGITIRSLSRYLALCYESVEIRWRSIGPGPAARRSDHTFLLVPWPLSVSADDFRIASALSLDNMDTDRFGFFEFDPEPLDVGLVDSLLAAAVARAGSVDAVVFPEAALWPDAVEELEHSLARHGASILIAGVRDAPTPRRPGRNYLHFGIHTETGWQRYEQDKHHRWCLDERQLRQYHLTRSLPPGKLWWEAIDIRERALHVIDAGRGMTTAPLVCEDLARLDEVADLVRRIGPDLVVALLLDGPQLATRWPCRYASVIADDPGSAVLTLTPFGMAVRSRPPGTRRSRVVAHWNDAEAGPREIELARGAAAVLLSASVRTARRWTADGRCHQDVPRLVLTDVRQMRAGPSPRPGARASRPRRPEARRRRAGRCGAPPPGGARPGP